MGVIYQIFCTENKKCYIGQTRQQNYNIRWYQHKHQAFIKKSEHSALYCAMRKYGLEKFEFIILLKDIENEKLNDVEEDYIKKFNSLTPNGYNLKEGGSHTPHSDETRRKIGLKSLGRKAVLGQKRTEEQRQRIGNGSRGRKFSQEVKDHLKEVHNRWHDEHPIPHKNCKYTVEDIRYMRNNLENLSFKDMMIKFNIKKPYILKQIIEGTLYKRVKS